jgi:hypothetical protein
MKRIRWKRVLVAGFILILTIFILVFGITKLLKNVENKEKSPKIIEKIPKNEEKIAENTEKPVEIVENQPKTVIKGEFPFRMTSYWTGDSGYTSSVTGSGKSAKDFAINDNGWYTYNGKIVLAAATNECLNSRRGACGKWNTPIAGKHYFNYYDELEVMIDGNVYTGIVLDSCGACMFVKNEERLDLFVSSKNYAIDRGYKGNNPVFVLLEVK